jgi:hypothetical protein
VELKKEKTDDCMLMRKLKMKRLGRGHWNRVLVSKLFVEQRTSEPKVKAYLPVYEPLEIVKCERCGKVITQPKELIKIQKQSVRQILTPNTYTFLPSLSTIPSSYRKLT